MLKLSRPEIRDASKRLPRNRPKNITIRLVVDNARPVNVSRRRRRKINFNAAFSGLPRQSSTGSPPTPLRCGQCLTILRRRLKGRKRPTSKDNAGELRKNFSASPNAPGTHTQENSKQPSSEVIHR